MMRPALLYAALLPLILGCGRAAACEPQLAVSNPAAVYVPFAAEPVIRELTLRLHNTGGSGCALAVAVYADTADLRSGWGELRFGVSAPGGEELLNSGVPPQNRGADRAVDVQIAAGAEAALVWRIILPAGQIPAPGMYSSLLRVALYDATTGALRQELLAVTVSATVDATLRLSLAGGGQGATLDFGRMTDGAVRTVLLRARANLGFRLNLASANGGAMILQGSLGDGPQTRARYRMSVNGGPLLGLETPQDADVSPHATMLGGMSVPLEIVLGETGHLRAGQYRDVVTITVDAAF